MEGDDYMDAISYPGIKPPKLPSLGGAEIIRDTDMVTLQKRLRISHEGKSITLLQDDLTSDWSTKEGETFSHRVIEEFLRQQADLVNSSGYSAYIEQVRQSQRATQRERQRIIEERERIAAAQRITARDHSEYIAQGLSDLYHGTIRQQDIQDTTAREPDPEPEPKPEPKKKPPDLSIKGTLKRKIILDD